MKINCLGLELSDQRKAFWQQQLPSRQIEFETIADLTGDWKNQGDLYLIDPDKSVEHLEKFERISAEARTCHGFDVILHLQQQWWPRVFTKAALKFMIVKRAPLLNTQGMAYVTGIGLQARASIAVLLELGFNRIRVIWPEGDEAEKVLAALRSQYFLTDIKWMADEELTLQPNNGSILINTRSHENNETLVDDLSYLNFLQKDGLVAEFWQAQGVNRILQESQNIGQSRIRPADLVGAFDGFVWAEIMGVSQSEELSKFVVQWAEKWIEQIPD